MRGENATIKLAIGYDGGPRESINGARLVASREEGSRRSLTKNWFVTDEGLYRRYSAENDKRGGEDGPGGEKGTRST